MTTTAQDRITPGLVAQGLSTTIVGRDIRFFDSIGSTNAAAKELAGQGAADGTVIVADHQTDGRGRLDRSWESPAGLNLLFSVILRPDLPTRALFRLTMAASVATVDAIESIAGVRCGVKWPNDVYAADKKICGILTEVDCTPEAVRYGIVGIGINVNWELARHPVLGGIAVSLRDICGRHVPRPGLLRELLQRLDAWYGRIDDGPALQRAWTQRCAVLDRPVQVDTGDELVQGVARGISPDGHLLVDGADGRRHEIICGDVSLKR